MTSCSTIGHAPILVSDYCDIAKPILLSPEEIPLLTQETKRQILVHNKTWRTKCGTETR